MHGGPMRSVTSLSGRLEGDAAVVEAPAAIVADTS